MLDAIVVTILVQQGLDSMQCGVGDESKKTDYEDLDIPILISRALHPNKLSGR